MALDVTAYARLERAHQYASNAFELRAAPDFPRHVGAISEGRYTAGSTYDFRAGSYGSYNEWRDALAKLAGYAPSIVPDYAKSPHAATVWLDQKAGPFCELINFSDCDGFIGWPVTAKICGDFVLYAGRAAGAEDDWFRSLYRHFRTAFEIASDHGAVAFH